MRTSIRSLLGIVAMVVWTGGITAPAIAQVAVVPVEPEPAVKPFQLRFGYGYQANTDLKKSGGDFHRNDWMGSLNAQVSFSDDFKLDNVLRYEYHNYNFSSSSPFQ